MLTAIRKRRSIRQFKNQKVPDSILEEILKAASFAPSARNTKAWEFIIIKNKETRDKLAQMKPHSTFANLAPVILILCSKDWDYWIEDLSIVVENIYLECTNQGLGTCCIQVRGCKTFDQTDCEEYVKNLLNIPKEYRILCIMPIGYPDEQMPEHSDDEFNKEKIHYEKW